MKKVVYLLIGLVFLTSCNSIKKEEDKKQEELVMYEFSEMALLMEEMYKTNEKLKEKIENNEDIGEFSQDFLNIHSAILTDPNDRTESFEVFSKSFIENQQAIFTAPKEEVKNQFNTMVNSCVACHKTTCQGPIPRIKKLIIK